MIRPHKTLSHRLLFRTSHAAIIPIAKTAIDISTALSLTWFASGRLQLQCYGFFAIVSFGAIYYILPQVTRLEFPYPKFVRLHFWVAAAGIAFIVLPLALGGMVQAVKMHNPNLPFLEVIKSTLPFLRASTLGDLLLFGGHVLFLSNVAGLVVRFSRAPVTTAYAAMTAELFKVAEEKP